MNTKLKKITNTLTYVAGWLDTLPCKYKSSYSKLEILLEIARKGFSILDDTQLISLNIHIKTKIYHKATDIRLMEFLASKIRSFILMAKCCIPKTPFDFVYIQAILFYIPRWLWKNWEAGKISSLKMDLDQGIIT